MTSQAEQQSSCVTCDCWSSCGLLILQERGGPLLLGVVICYTGCSDGDDDILITNNLRRLGRCLESFPGARGDRHGFCLSNVQACREASELTGVTHRPWTTAVTRVASSTWARRVFPVVKMCFMAPVTTCAFLFLKKSGEIQ